MDNAIRAHRPMHLWIVGVFATVWNGFGAFDYLMTQTRNAAYLAQFSAEERAYFEAFPAWADAFWALGVWGGLAGALLLIARRRIAVGAFLVSLAGMFVGLGYQLGVGEVPESLSSGLMALFPYVIIGVGIALLMYARAMAATGALR